MVDAPAQMDEAAVDALCHAAESIGDAYTAAVCCRALHGIVPIDLIRMLTIEQWRIVEHMSQRNAERTVIAWLRPPNDPKTTVHARPPTDPVTFAKGTPHK